jgi:hypothetical protein
MLAQKATTRYGQMTFGVIAEPSLSKFNIFPKAFIPNTASILLLQKVIKF